MKRPLFVPFLFVAFVVAAVVARMARAARRALGARPRILRGIAPMVGLNYNMLADRFYGYESDIIVEMLDRFGYPYVFRTEVTAVIGVDAKGSSFWRKVRLFFSILFRYDIWVTYFDGSLFRFSTLYVYFQPYEATILRLAGIKIVALPYGADVQRFDGLKTRFNWIERLWADYSHKYGDVNVHNAKVQQQVAYFTRHADFIVGGDHSLLPFLPRVDLNFKYYPIDLDEWRPGEPPKNELVRIVHAPNHRNVKGTDILLEACDRLKREGFRFELELVERVPRNEVRAIYERADILAEQFVIGSYGLNALEGLALEKPVLSYSSQEELSDRAFSLPVVNTHEQNIDDVLKALIRVPVLRERLGRAGREAVERYQSIRAVGEVWDRIYRYLWWREPLRLETTGIFSVNRPARSQVEDPRDAQFWPVDVRDLLPAIRDAIDRPVEVQSGRPLSQHT